MLCPDTVFQLNVVFVTGPSAIPVIRSIGQKGAKNTMLHVKHRHVLVNR